MSKKEINEQVLDILLQKTARGLGLGDLAGLLNLENLRFIGGWVKDQGKRWTSELNDKIERARLVKLAESGDLKAMNELASRSPGQDAVHWFQCAAKAGDVNALFNLGVCYVRGDEDIPRDLKTAIAWFQKAAENGCVEAMDALGVCYYCGDDNVPADRKAAIEWWLCAAKLGDADAMFNLSVCYSEEGNKKEAEYWLEQSAKLEYPKALNQSALRWVEKGDFEQAVREFQRAAERDNAEATFNLALCYARGLVKERQDMAQARDYYRRAANLGHAEAMLQLGLLCEETNTKRAITWYSRAAEAGNVNAMYNLGVCYARGDEEVPRDLKTAIAWFQKAAEGGIVKAACAIGLCYYCGDDNVPADRKRAIEWWLCAAKLGDVEAMDSLSHCYYKEGNRKEAMYWRSRAAEARRRKGEN